MPPLVVEVITYAPTQYLHCPHCEFVWNKTQMDSVQKFHADAHATSIPPELMDEYRTLSDWIIQIANRYGNRLHFRVIDAASLEGVWKSLRYGVHRYPAFIIGGREKISGNDLKRVEERLDQHLAAQAA